MTHNIVVVVGFGWHVVFFSDFCKLDRSRLIDPRARAELKPFCLNYFVFGGGFHVNIA